MKISTTAFITTFITTFSALILPIIMTSSAMAGATILLQGKLFSFTQTEYLIQTKKSIYHVARSALSEEQAKKLEKPDANVSLVVPMEAIVQVRPLKAQAQR